MNELIISICGNPNSGKSTLFNALTGSNQKTGNWPGVTVERKEGLFNCNGKEIKIIDLPGSYSLSAYSVDEQITRDFLLSGESDLNIIVIDSINLDRNLYLAIELLEIQSNCVLVLNMMDMVNKLEIKIDVERLSKILKVPVIPTVATAKEGINKLVQFLCEYKKEQRFPTLEIDYGPVVENAICKVTEILDKAISFQYHLPCRWIAIKIFEEDHQVISWIKKILYKDIFEELQKEIFRLKDHIKQDLKSYFIEKRYDFISELIKKCVFKPKEVSERLNLSDKIDKIILNKWLGIPLFLFFMWIMFKLTFSIGNIFSDQIDLIFSTLANWIKNFLGEGWLSSLISDGIISGVGSVLVFLPNIMILFIIIGLLEDCGYMARAAFVMDRFMHMLGLHGKSFIPMILGFGCNIPGVMACRTLESEKDRILTIIINPFMSCSARLPIYILFAGTFFSKHAGTVIFMIYVLGIGIAILTAILFNNIFFKTKVAPLIMELPPYRIPTFKGILINMWMRSIAFLKKAGTIIFIGVCLVWFLSSMPPGIEYASSNSWIGYIGNFFAPIFKPAGFGFWQAAVALIFGILAKEIVVGTLGTLYGVKETYLNTILTKYFTQLSAFSFMIMSLLYIPCIASIGVIKSETNSWKWTVLAIFWSFFIGWSTAVIFYQIAIKFL